jgi:hypothetical protein
MKKMYLFLFFIAIFLSCSKVEITPETPQEEAKIYTVSFKMGGEITSISDSPLRATPNDLYGIQVYSKAHEDDSESPYAYGLFDDPTSISIKLMSGYIYSFVCTMVVDGKNKLSGSVLEGYTQPFTNTEGSVQNRTKISTNFIYSSNGSLAYIDKGLSYIYTPGGGDKSYSRPNTDRYYGTTSDFVPSENGIVNINMKRTVFGVKIVAQDFSEGKLAIQLTDCPLITLTYPTTEIQEIYAFSNVVYAYIDSDYYTENVNLQINWIKNDGATVPIANQTLTFTRNKLTTINVKVDDLAVNNGIGIDLDNTPINEGDTINVGVNNSIDTPVNP